MFRVAETLGCPLFVVEEFPADELSKWAVYFDIQKDIRDGKPLISNDTITVEQSEERVMEFFKSLKGDE